MDELIEKVTIGPVASRAQSFAEVFGWAPKDFTNLKVNAIDALAKYVKAQTGAQVTDKEREWLEAALPDINMGPETFKNRNAELQRRLRMIKDRNLSLMKSLQGKNIPKEYELGEATSYNPTRQDVPDIDISDDDLDAQIEQLTRELAE